MKGWLRSALWLIFRVRVHGLERLRRHAGRLLILSNHASRLDAILLALFLPGPLALVVDERKKPTRWTRLLERLTPTLPGIPGQPEFGRRIAGRLKKGERILMFPECDASRNGAMGKLYPGTGWIADQADAPVLTVRIEGSQYSHASRAGAFVKRRWFPRIDITLHPIRPLEPPHALNGPARRAAADQQVADRMWTDAFKARLLVEPLSLALERARRRYGNDHPILDDAEGNALTYGQLVTRAFILGRELAASTSPGERVGVMLPNVTGAAVTFFALHFFGRIPALLNFTAGASGMGNALETARLHTVLTSRLFIEKANLEKDAAALEKRARLIYLEDLKPLIGLGKKLRGLWDGRRAGAVLAKNLRSVTPDDPAVILFTSGSEGRPKGVALSHANLLANGAQVLSRSDFTPRDVVLNILPMFHSFGISVGTLMPLFSGMKVVFHPSPLDYRAIPDAAYRSGATILFGANAFLAGYAKNAHPYDFSTLRHVFAGAEKLQEETVRLWQERFGVRILEGYGATEASPVISVNTPMENKPGTVGRFLPGIDHYLEPVQGIAHGGRLVVRGPNVMRGYLLPDAPGEITPPATDKGEKWYDTGDVVTVDGGGYVAIQGRLKRFAKIGGEMVSLGAVEVMVQMVWPEELHAAVNLPDPAKGEQVVLLTEREKPDRMELIAYARENGLAEINTPRKVLTVPQIPLLGTGKTDYPACHALAVQLLTASGEPAASL